jgi:hypothetical protein
MTWPAARSVFAVLSPSALLIGAVMGGLLLAGCDDQKRVASQRATNPQKYDQDTASCRAQVDEYMQSRQRVDDSQRSVFADDRDRFGQGALPAQMNNYADSRSGDSVMSDCMQAHGWDQPKGWTSTFGRPHTF